MTISNLVKLSKKGQIAIPKKIREKTGIKIGEKVIIFTRGDEVVLLTPKKYASYTCGLLKNTWGATKKEIDSYIEEERDSWK